MKLLFEYEADLHANENFRDKEIIRAAASCNDVSLRRLIQHGDGLSAEGNAFGTASIAVAYGGH